MPQSGRPPSRRKSTPSSPTTPSLPWPTLDLQLFHLDVVSAFTNAVLDEAVYVVFDGSFKIQEHHVARIVAKYLPPDITPVSTPSEKSTHLQVPEACDEQLPFRQLLGELLWPRHPSSDRATCDQ
mmetsp:Transcript_23290/g.32175  ORF Transcript_23290/g.32175 Transcript_23290/m.32175 type:complete len:125 (+) Transcript_23290:149-523(+)